MKIFLQNLFKKRKKIISRNKAKGRKASSTKKVYLKSKKLANRKNSKLITKCIWNKSDEKLDFFMSDNGTYSTLNDFIDNDKKYTFFD